jgi:hypothetical protein
MTPASALLPYERHCPDCNGEGRVECLGVHPRRLAGGITVMEQPDVWTETCSRCDGTGVVMNDRRESERTPGSPLVEAFRQARADLGLAHATVVHLESQVDVLILENRAQRRIILEQAKVLDRADFKPTKGDAHAPTH